MITIGLYEAKATLGQLAQAAAEGEVVVLTRRGRPLAEIRSPEREPNETGTRSAIEALRAFRRTNRVGSFDIGEVVTEGRR